MNEEFIACVKELNNIEYECLAMLTQEYRNVLDETITDSQVILLNHLHDSGRLPTGKLAKLMNTTPSALSQMLNRMEKQQLVTRSINPDNRREIFVELGTSGIHYIETSRKIEMSIIERYYSKLSLVEIKTLKEIMLKFKRIIEQEQSSKVQDQS